jgi:hypothetical protein
MHLGCTSYRAMVFALRERWSEPRHPRHYSFAFDGPSYRSREGKDGRFLASVAFMAMLVS